MRTRLLLVTPLLLAPLASAQITSAPAPKCTFSATPISFGTVDVKNGRPYDATGTFNYTCTGDAREIVRICPNLGLPKDGPRFLTDDAGHKLLFNLYTDEARTDVWGSLFAKTSIPTVEAPIGRSERVTGSVTIYGRVEPNQSGVAPGVYKSAISGSNSVTNYAYASQGACRGAFTGQHGNPAVTISARVSGDPSSQPITAPDASHSTGSAQVNTPAEPEHRGFLGKMIDNAQYQQDKQRRETSSTPSSSSTSAGVADRAAYLETHSCMTTASAEKADALADDCNRATSAPHSRCSIQQNTCDEIRHATVRGCNGLGSQAPDFCLTRYR